MKEQPRHTMVEILAAISKDAVILSHTFQFHMT